MRMRFRKTFAELRGLGCIACACTRACLSVREIVVSLHSCETMSMHMWDSARTKSASFTLPPIEGGSITQSLLFSFTLHGSVFAM